MALKASSYYLALCMSFMLMGQDTIKIIWEDQTATSVEVAVAFSDSLQVSRVGNPKGIAGKFSGSSPVLFTPFLPFSEGASYEIRNGSKPIAKFTIPTKSKPPHVMAIYPAIDSLPSNFLKFYIQFDQPMTSLSPYEHFALLYEGQKIDRAFLETTPPLWNDDRTRLTLWIEPGRIKRDLGPNRKLGAVLEEGKTYQLMVNKELTSSAGQQLASEHIKRFTVTAADTTSPSIDSWIVSSPRIKTQDTLSILMSEPMDQSVLDYFEVEGMPGRLFYVDDTSYYFVPDLPWTRRNYTIRIKSIAEDLAGNNFNRRFEEDIANSNSERWQQLYQERMLLIKK